MWQEKEELRASMVVKTRAVQALPRGLSEGRCWAGWQECQREALSLFTFFFFLIV